MASESSQGNFNNGPSSPDDSFTSQIGNTNSSPGDASRRRRRGRSTTPAASATPTAPPSRFAASSEATPTPSAGTRRNGSNGKRRAPSAAATPTSTDDLPPSSEGGDGFDMDEDRPTFVWGTNISVNDVKAAIVRFLKNFRDQQSQTPDSEFHTEGKYIETIKRVLEIEGDSLDVNAHDVFDYDSDLYAKMVRYPLEVLAIFDIVLMEMVPLIEPLFEKHIQTRIYNLKTSTSMRNLNPCDIERMVSLKGMVIRCSSIIPEIREAIFRCLVCGYYSEPVAVEKGRITEPTRCLKEECQARNSMTLVHNRCRFTDKQIVRLQETPDEILEGGTPHTVSLLMHDKLVDAGKPGDRVEVTGIYRAMTVRIGPAHRTVKSLFKTYIDCLHIKKTDKSRMLVDDQMEIDNPLGGNSDDIVFDEKKVEELKELSKQPDIYDRLMRSLAPNIWELDDVKRGLLCQLFGGIALKLPSGANFRGDINILLVGDPGTSKSQLLQYIHKLSPRGIYTSGRGSSAVGLTAYVTKDPETGETVLESGALVLSDRGICCIDEFDKMSDNARSMLHEVMEQQTVSIAKAGIIASLNARASVLACANPSGSRYNPRLSVIDNIHLPPTLLSRFDLIYLILDKADEHTDRRLAKHIVALHFENPESIEQDVLDLPTLIAYVSYARKHIHPQLSDEAAEDLTRGYVDLRRRGNFPGSGKKVITATPRQIESLIRLSEALARIRFSEVVEKRDVTEAFRLLEVAMQQSATDHSTGTIDMDLITTGVSASERMRRENLLSATRNLIMEKMQLGGPSMRLLERERDRDRDRESLTMAEGGGGCCPPMDLFRSEPMQLVQLIIPIESAHLTVSYLGDLGLLQFKDLNSDKSPFQRTYATQIKRCGELARKLRFFKEQMSKAGFSPKTSTTRAEINLDDLEVKLGELESELVEMNANSEKLQRSYNELAEYKLVLQKAADFFHAAHSSALELQRESESREADDSLETPLLLDQEISTDPSKQVKLGYLTGLVPREKSMAFERILFRATRGNVFLKQATLENPVTDPISGEKVEKNVFLVFYSGEKAKNKILKICEAFGANRYPFTEDLGRQVQSINEVSARLSELKTTIDAGLLHRGNLLQTIGDQFERWNLVVRKEKSIYHTLNMLSLDVTKKCLVAEGWSPIFATKQIQDALERGAYDSNSQVGAIFQVLHTKESPPTYFRTNKFTTAFQEIVDAYGVAKYQEANPGVYTIVTFPFLFAVMFGDWGHGICLLLATLYFIIREKKLSSQKLGDITEMTFGGRYVILMMSIFSIYTGLIYNEFFSVPLELFGRSAYACRDLSCGDSTTMGLIKVRPTYPFGLDPVWHGTRSELPFLNSLKMKMSILIGVTQMNLGIVISYFNALYFKNSINVWFQFIPQLIFLNSLFGYLSVLIVMKWCTGSQADLYHVMIYMFLSPTDDLGENQLFPGQKLVQLVLLFLALVAVPWMLIPKPFLLKKQHEARHQGESYALLETTEESLQVESANDSHGGHGEEFEFSEVFVHQLIHTIEFVLGAVSNTASYLRLWALSLAHSELSSVFYDKVLLLAWGFNNVFILIIGIVVFVFATVGVLLVMETLSAFLHALRLHWVEFQNKFYEGDGYKFQPFSFLVTEEEEE
ncbi:hypothetical protein G4B88_021399 [Cannabis sativa]|uniref:DNA helicase n=1 Tax=Cannabis sativa TaxID=3483 RepID=A0A7J6FFW1_CANSA|nr:hypothetical protein G4B88_021399 [Cannabis sativa]